MQSQMETKGKRRGKSDPRMAVIKWARENGAVHIKVDGIELVFPPDYSVAATDKALSPEDVVSRGTRPSPFDEKAPNPPRFEHPAEYAQNSDAWANFPPIATRG